MSQESPTPLNEHTYRQYALRMAYARIQFYELAQELASKHPDSLPLLYTLQELYWKTQDAIDLLVNEAKSTYPNIEFAVMVQPPTATPAP